jgi:hypothetical protein
MEDSRRNSEGSMDQKYGKGDKELGGVVGGSFNLDTAQKVSGGGVVGGVTAFGASAGAAQETGEKLPIVGRKREGVGNPDNAQKVSDGGGVVRTAQKVSYADTVRGASAASSYNTAYTTVHGNSAGDSAGVSNITAGGAYYNRACGANARASNLTARGDSASRSDAAHGSSAGASNNTARGANARASNHTACGDIASCSNTARDGSAGASNNTAGGAAYNTARGTNARASNVATRSDSAYRGDTARGGSAGASNNTAGGAAYNTARDANYGASNVAARGDSASRGDTSHGGSAGASNNTASGAAYNTARGSTYNTSRGANAEASNVAARGDSASRGDTACGGSAGASNNTAGGAYYNRARGDNAGGAAYNIASGAKAGASNLTDRGGDRAHGTSSGGAASNITAGCDITADGDSNGGAASNITDGGDITSDGESAARGACNTSHGGYYTDTSVGASPMSLPHLPMRTVEMNPPGADEDACPARGTNKAAFPARGSDEDVCPARSAHKASRPASDSDKAIVDENFPSMSPLPAAHGHGDDSLVDSENETPIIEYYFVWGDADDDSVSNTPTARGLYGQSFASEEVIEEAYLYIKSHPCMAMKSIITKSRHIASMGKTSFQLDEDEWKAPIRSYLETLVSFDSCFNNKSCYFIKCSCLKSLDSLTRAVPYFTKIDWMNKLGQDAFFKELINSRKRRSGGYNMWIGSVKNEGFPFMVCRPSFLNLLNLGDERLKGILVTRYDPGPDMHNSERHTIKNGWMKYAIRDGAVDYLREQGQLYGECYATHTVRVLINYELRDEEKGTIDLPSHYTQRNMYEQYCYENGWLTRSDNKGRYPPLAEYKKRKVDDLLWEANVETTEIVAWWTFRKIWKEHWPTIRIQKPCNETCGECTIFRNAFRYRKSHQKVDDSESETLSDNDESDNENDIDAAINNIETIEGNISTLAMSFLAWVEHDT